MEKENTFSVQEEKLFPSGLFFVIGIILYWIALGGLFLIHMIVSTILSSVLKMDYIAIAIAIVGIIISLVWMYLWTRFGNFFFKKGMRSSKLKKSNS